MIAFSEVVFELHRELRTFSVRVPGELVSDLKSSDDQVSKEAMEKADCFIAELEEPCRTKMNKTRINTTPSRQDSLVKRHHTRIEAHCHLRKKYIFLLLLLLFFRICRTAVQVSVTGHLEEY